MAVVKTTTKAPAKKKEVIIPYKPNVGDILYNKNNAGKLVKDEVYGTIEIISDTHIHIRRRLQDDIYMSDVRFFDEVFHRNWYVILPEVIKKPRVKKVKE